MPKDNEHTYSVPKELHHRVEQVQKLHPGFTNPTQLAKHLIIKGLAEMEKQLIDWANYTSE